MNLAFDDSKVLNRLRVIATLLVVIGHATRMFTAQGVYHDSIQENLILTKITGIIYSFHMPLFFLISGYVYGICLNKGGVYKTFMPFIKKKSQRLLFPYFFWGIAYVSPIMVCLSITTMPYHTFVYQGIVLGLNCRHLWFLFTLFEVFVAVHVYVLMSKKIGFHYLVAIPALLAVSFVIRYIPHVPRAFQLASFCDYTFYFVCGLALFAIKGLGIKCVWGGGLALITCVLLCKSIGLIGSVFTLITLLLAWCIPMETLPGYKAFLQNSMGIYILHPMMLYALFYFYKSTINAYLFTASAIIVVTILSFLGCALLRHYKLAVLFGE